MSKLLSTTEAAIILGISKRRVIALINEGRLPADVVGGRFIIKEKDLEKVKIRKPGFPKGKKRN